MIRVRFVEDFAIYKLQMINYLLYYIYLSINLNHIYTPTD